MRPMKAHFDDRVVTTRDIVLVTGQPVPEGTSGFVIEALADPEERYEVEFDLDDDVLLGLVGPDDFEVADSA